MPDLFSDNENDCNSIVVINNISSHLIDNYTIFVNRNDPGMEFQLP
jgi:hypothetical protein